MPRSSPVIVRLLSPPHSLLAEWGGEDAYGLSNNNGF
jgi:hypothetical protein